MKKWMAWLKGETTGWKTWELGWMLFCCGMTVGLALYLGDNWLGIVSSLTGTLYALFAGKGKISCYLFGVVNTIAYGWISCGQTLYGEVMLNWGWYLPMMFVGVYFWRRNLNREQVIVKTRLSWRGRLIAGAVSLAGIAVYALVLHYMGDRSPVLDSITTVLSVTAMVLTVKRCLEQWLLWIVVNVVSIWMWLGVYLRGGESGATLLMWCVALANGIIFFIQWSREEKTCLKREP